MREEASSVEVLPLTRERWPDFAALCRQMGSNRSCYCMWWRERRATAGTAERARSLVESSERSPGLIAYAEGRPIGWVAVAPRDEYPRLQAGRDTAPVDDRPHVWVVSCFFVVPDARGRGMAKLLLESAVEFAFAHGAEAVDGIPRDPAMGPLSSSANYTGSVGMFAAAGFKEVARRSPKGRVVMRREGTEELSS